MIRKANQTDLPPLVAIYNQAITSRCCTGDTACLRIEERLPWFESHENPKTPIFVYEIASQVVAYSSISPYRPGRQAFERVGEVSYYVDFHHHGKGIGKQMLAHLMIEAKKAGYIHLLAIILDCNVKSASLLRKFGFSLWGKLPNIANIDDKYYSHLYYGLTLS